MYFGELHQSFNLLSILKIRTFTGKTTEKIFINSIQFYYLQKVGKYFFLCDLDQLYILLYIANYGVHVI